MVEKAAQVLSQREGVVKQLSSYIRSVVGPVMLRLVLIADSRNTAPARVKVVEPWEMMDALDRLSATARTDQLARSPLNELLPSNTAQQKRLNGVCRV